MKDLRERIGHAVTAAKIDKRVTPHTFRHTYAAARLQTLHHGAPVSPYTVMRELGHSSIQLIERTYGHLIEHAAPGKGRGVQGGEGGTGQADCSTSRLRCSLLLPNTNAVKMAASSSITTTPNAAFTF